MTNGIKPIVFRLLDGFGLHAEDFSRKRLQVANILCLIG